MNRLEDIISSFQNIDDEFKLELLLDYADKMPSPSPDFQSRKDLEMQRISECQTPVYLLISNTGGKIVVQAIVPAESPTIRGIVSIIWHALNGLSVKELGEIPMDLLNRLGLSQKIGMLRIHGITAIIHRVNQQVQKIQAKNTPA